MINETDAVPRHTLKVMGRRMSYGEMGNGPPVVFVHGNATYSYAWRNLLPYVSFGHRCLAPDLPGMGRSERVDPSGTASYSFDDQATALELFIRAIEPRRRVVLVGHEMGSALAIQYTRKNRQSVAGLVLIEGVFRATNDTLFDPEIIELLTQVRGEEGEALVLQHNLLIEEHLPRLISRTLTTAEMDSYRGPYEKPGESRRAMLSMIRQLPLQSSTGPIDDLVEESRLWCAQSRTPKLVVGGNPGFLVPPSVLGTAARWSNTNVASVPGLHFLMEDSPARLTATILDWLTGIRHGR